jgi:hypothetical protein
MRKLGGRTGALRRVLVAGLALGILASVGVASAASAKTPTGDFAVFSQCPRFTTGVKECLFSQTKSGEVTLNKQNVPIVNTITLQGGLTRVKGAETFVGALNGETLSKTAQPVPGGLLGLVKCNEISNPIFRVACELVFQNGVTGVNAVTELAKPASDIGINTNNLVNQEGVALSLPVKIHLENPFLGGSCYIGSESSPIVWNLTTGTTSPAAPNKPISGKVGEIVLKDEANFVELTGNSLVDNAYSAPESSGCGEFLGIKGVLDGIINGKIGLPSADGKNTTILNNTIREATAEAVIESEK